MGLLRPGAALRCVRNLPHARRSMLLPTTTRAAFSLSARRNGGAAGGKDEHHDSPFDPPTGWLWGVPPGEKKEREMWEIPMYVYVASFVVTGIVLAFKPDTSLDTWALEEARRRLEKEGILEDPYPEGKSS